MKSSFLRSLAPVFVGLFLWGCSSVQPYRYYTLQPVVEPGTRDFRYSVGVAPVKIPGWMDRSDLAYTEDRFELHFMDYDRWGEPVNDAITRITTSNLRRLLPEATVFSGPWLRSEAPVMEVRIEVLDLAKVQDQLSLTVRWDVISDWGKDQSSLGTFSKQVGGDISPGELVEAYSDLLADVAIAISAF